MKCILEKTPLKHKSIRLVPRNSRGKELLERMRRQNKKWGNFLRSRVRQNGLARPSESELRATDERQQSKQIESRKEEDYEEEQDRKDAGSRMYCDFEDRRPSR